MALAKRSVVFAGLAVSAAIFGTPAQAAPMVTYTWTTTSEGFGPHVSAPSSATFEAPLSDVLAGVIPQSDTQGLAVIAFAGTDINAATTFLSILVDKPVSGKVADEFNALNNGSPYAGFPTAGFWTASFPALTPVPESSTWVMMLLGFSALGFGGYRASRRSVAQGNRGSLSG